MRHIESMSEKYLVSSLELVETVFTEHENAEEGRMVRSLVEEIRAGKYYVPELELLMIEDGEPVGYVMFSRFELDGKYSDELLILTPAAVKTALQRQHISKELIEYGFEKAREMGFRASLVEGNPANYRPRGFVTAMDHGIMPGKTVHLPHRDCLMVAELAEGALGAITGTVEYSMYKSLVGGAE